MSAYILITLLTLVASGSVFFFVAYSQGITTLNIGPGTNLANAQVRVGGDFDWLQEITRAFVRIGGVLMAVFIINILVSFARYNLKTANSLDSRADCILLAGEDMERLAALLAVISIDIIDFSKFPTSPYDTYLGVLKGWVPGKGAIEKEK